jgi:hypothetical protein
MAPSPSAFPILNPLLAAFTGEEAPENGGQAADFRIGSEQDLGPLQSALNHDQAHLFGKICNANRAFLQVKPGEVHRLRRLHGDSAITEALRGLSESVPKRIQHPGGYLEAVIAQRAGQEQAG